MKINYPVKYAAMPIIEQVGWSMGLHEKVRDYDVVCYIVSKCYLINESKIYKEDGHVIKEYEVVFPYQYNDFNKWRREIPSYNLIHGNCTNSNKVDEIFESYDEVLNYVTNKNNELCEKSWKYMSYSKDFLEKVQEKVDSFNMRLTKYKLLEEQILLNTIDMETNKNKELGNVIKIEKKEAKICKANIYEILNIFDKEHFAIYSISNEQYDNLVNLIKEEKFDNKKKIPYEGLLIHDKNNELLKTTIEEKNILSFYTTEPVEDILKSNEKSISIDLNEVKENTLIKKI